MVTEVIKFFIDNLLQKGNILGLDKRILDIYFGSAIKSDSDSDIILHMDPYSVFGGFLEAFAIWFHEDNSKDSLLKALQDFLDNIHDHEKLIIKRMQWYLDRVKTIVDFLRRIYGKIRVAYSELTSGIDLFLLGRSELAKKLLLRKINEWLHLGGKKIILTDPIEYSFLSTFGSTVEENLVFLIDILRNNATVMLPKDTIIYEPFETPILLFPKQLREKAISSITSVLFYFRSHSSGDIPTILSGSPFCYEQIFLIDPLLSTSGVAQFLGSVTSKNIVTFRVLTALVLRVSAYIHNIDVNVADYAYWLVKGE